MVKSMRSGLASGVLTTMIMAAGAPANAFPTLELSIEGVAGTTVTVHDQGAGDLNGTADVVAFSGNVGNFRVNYTAGLSQSGTFLPELMHVSSSDSAGAGQTLVVRFSDDNYTQQGLTTLNVGIGGFLGQGASLSYEVYYDTGNTKFATTELVGETQEFSSGAFSGLLSEPVDLGIIGYALTQVIKLTHTQDTSSSFDTSISVPEPGPLAIFGLGLAGLGFARRRIRSA